jgi:hypothetical protein
MPIAIKLPTSKTLAPETAKNRQHVEKQTATIKKQVAARRKKRKPAKQAKPRKRA